MKISFNDITVSTDGVVHATVVRDDREDAFWIRLPYAFTPASDLIAISIAAMCGQAFETVHIELPVGPETHRKLEASMQCYFSHLPGDDIIRTPGSDTILNFSGGFDSLAAKTIQPGAHLVSLDFGGRFARERTFFEKFSTLIFETNLVEIGLNKYSWQFMGLGSILLIDELPVGHYAFGSIMASSLRDLIVKPKDQTVTRGALGVSGLSPRNPVAGLSEIASLALLMRSNHDIVGESLRSLAGVREEKYRRKYIMVCAVADRLGIEIDLAGYEPAKRPAATWGDSFATDLSSLYALGTRAHGMVRDSYIAIPDSALELAKDPFALDFMHRFNPHAIWGVPGDEVGEWLRAYSQYQILPFIRDDWQAAEQAVSVLSRGFD